MCDFFGQNYMLALLFWQLDFCGLGFGIWRVLQKSRVFFPGKNGGEITKMRGKGICGRNVPNAGIAQNEGAALKLSYGIINGD